VPGETGVMLTSIPAKCRPLASGFGQGSYNIFGYSLGIFLPGAVMSLASGEDNEDQETARNLGMKLLFSWSFFGVVGLLSSLYYVKRSEAAHGTGADQFAEFEDEEDDEDNLMPANLLENTQPGPGGPLRPLAPVKDTHISVEMSV